MLTVLNDFRERIDSVMHKCMKKTVIIWGYGYSGRFVAWYGEYYHSIKPSYIVTEDSSSSIPYELPLYRKYIFDFGYKNVQECIVWLCTAGEDRESFLEERGYKKNDTYFNMNELVYGKSYDRGYADTNVQFLRYLENEYGCDFVERMDVESFSNVTEGMHPFVGMSPKELFPLLDKCHCIPSAKDAIFDFGCGKGGALVSFLDYGFSRIGGVEFVDSL